MAANRLSTVDHPNLAAIYEVATYRSSSYIELELVEGSSLAERLARTPQLPVDEVMTIGLKIAAALEAAHALGIVHGDLNPANVLFTDAGVAKVIDFRFLAGERSAHVPGHAVESPQFLSPEYVADRPLVASSDVYSLGVILYHSLSGRYPSDSQRSGEVPAVSAAGALAPDALRAVPPRLVELVMKCLAPKPEARFATARAFTEALERVERALDVGVDVTRGGDRSRSARGAAPLRARASRVGRAR
jgi:eukaryotic-like serine/threonine-protein kinase